MFKNAVRIAFRNLRRQKGYSFLNIGGLAIGLAAAAIIALFVRDELSYDRFQPAAERVYVLNSNYQYREGLNFHLRGVPIAMGEALVEDVPGVESAFRWNGASLKYMDVPELDRTEQVRFTDPSFLDMTAFRMLRGDPATALDEPNSLILTPEIAQVYFGAQDPLGQTLTTEDGDIYTVTGVIEAPPHNTEFQFELLAPHERVSAASMDDPGSGAWSPMGQTETYVRLASGYSIESFQELMPVFLSTYLGDEGAKLTINPQRLVDLHLRRDVGGNGGMGLYGDIKYVWMFSAIAALILLIACINYTNLATARALQRAREVGVRKSVGAGRGELVRRFLSESVFLSAMATLLAALLVDWGLPPFSRFVGREILANWMGDPWLIPGFAMMTLLVGVTAGLYPSFVLSRFKPVDALKGRIGGVDTKARLRKGLVTFQFVMSVGLIICTMVMLRQLTFMQNRKLGLEPDQVLTVRAGSQNADRFPILKEGFLRSPNVTSVTGGGVINDNFLLFFEETAPYRPSNDAIFVMNADHDFIRTYEMELVAGRNFDAEMTSERGDPVLINEAAARDLGLTDPVGTILKASADEEDSWEVVGVVKDFHYRSVKEAIQPLMIIQEEDSHDQLGVRFATGDVQATLASLEATWSGLFPEQPFSYSFLDEQFANLYRIERRTNILFSLAAGLAILVSCLGLFGLAAFAAEQRTKEIGIRKVLGASVGGIVGLLSKDFLKLVGIAFVISAPVAYFIMDRWLADYAYHIDLGPGIFALAALMAVFIAFGTVAWQAIRAATSDPVKALRYE